MSKKNPLSKAKLLEAIIEQSPIPVMVTDLEANIEYVNAMFTQITGYQAKEVVGKNPRLLKSGKTKPSVYKDLWRTIVGGHIWKGDLINRKKSGEIYVESIMIAPVKNKDGRIEHFVGMWQDTTSRRDAKEELRKLWEELQEASRTDALTGQFNRRRILEELRYEMERALRYRRSFCGMMMDLDGFKKVNDEYGHVAGDIVLRDAAHLFEQNLRVNDRLGRYGGDEFLALLPETDIEHARVVAERIQKAVRQHVFRFGSKQARLTVSIGLLNFKNIRKPDETSFIRRMDATLLKAKRAGRDRIVAG